VPRIGASVRRDEPLHDQFEAGRPECWGPREPGNLPGVAFDGALRLIEDRSTLTAEQAISK
jgi:hypothetical protein